MGTSIAVILVLGALWLAFRAFSKVSRSEGSRAPAHSSAQPPVSIARANQFKWPSLGDFDFDVVGESNYQAALKRIAGPHGLESAATECVATITPEDGNKFDASAVQVSVDGQVVGYLSREDARSFRRRLGAKRLTGQSTLCDAMVLGGGKRRDGEQMLYGIKLDLQPFDN